MSMLIDEVKKEMTDANITVQILQELIRDPRQATELIVQHIKSKKRIYTVRDDKFPEMYVYQDGIYLPNGESVVREIVRDIFGKAFTTHLSNEVIAKLQPDTFIDADDFFNQKDTILYELPVENGILNILTKELQPFTPEKRFFQKLPIRYDPNADCTKIKTFVHQIVETPDDMALIQEIFGFTLLRDYRYELAFMLCGSGRNGKGKLIALLKTFLGSHNVANIPLQDLDRDQYAAGELFNKLANLGTEISGRQLRSTALFKSLCGRDMITVNRKFKTRISFVNHAKLIFASNELPETEDLSPAFFMRWRLIDFPYTFVDETEYAGMTAEQREKCKIKDPNILDSLTTQEELSGLLNWALSGLERLLKNNQFTNSPTMQIVKTQWIRRANSFEAFFNDCLIQKEDSEIGKVELKRAYSEYCKRWNLKPKPGKEIKEYLDLRGFSEEREQGRATDQYRYAGLAINLDFRGPWATLNTLNYHQNVPIQKFPFFHMVENHNNFRVTATLNPLLKSGYETAEVINFPCSACGANISNGWHKGAPFCQICLKLLQSEERVE